MERIILTEADADEFLDSIGVTLYENSMTIGETEVSGVTGQAALQEYGIFLYEDCIMIQEYVSDYDYKKYKDLKYNRSAEDDKEYRRYYGRYKAEREKDDITIDPQKNFYYPHDKNQYYGTDHTVDRSNVLKQPNLSPKYKKDHLDKNSAIDNKANAAVDRELTRRGYQRANGDKTLVDITYYNKPKMMDAKARHIRRHPDQYKESSSIFSSIKFV